MNSVEVHKAVAAVLGELSLTMERKELPAPDVAESWVRRLRAAADGLERRLANRTAPE